MIQRFFSLFLFIFPILLYGQYNWELEKDKNGIQVYSSDVSYSAFKASKVECTLNGDYNKLISVLSDVSQMNTWVYKSKICKPLKSYTPLDFVYVSETDMPWPISNRESVIRFQFNTDSLPKFMTITGIDEQNHLPITSGLERVTNYKASWKVTMPTAETMFVEYILELDPGGGVPSWLANLMIEKGPFETFNSLSNLLKEESYSTTRQ